MKDWNKKKPELLQKLGQCVGNGYVMSSTEAVQDYLRDETFPGSRPTPAGDVVVVKPGTTEEIASILKLANELKFPVYPRGGGTGVAGGAVPTRNGIVLSLERMNRIIEVDRENLMLVVEAGAKLQDVLVATSDAGLTFPPHPGDETAQMGGLVVCNAGGARAVRYGIMRNYVKGLEVVLPTGEILNLGGKLLKDVAGYDLMHLLIGSEGTLGIVTKIILRLYPKFKDTATLVIPYKNRHDAIRTVPRILQEGMIPLAIEYVEKELMEKSAKNLGEPWSITEGNYYLIVIIAESTRDQVLSESLKVAEICKENGSLEPLFAEPREDQDRILRIRSNIYSILKPHTLDGLDLTVPPASIGKLADALEEIGRKYNAAIPFFGHAGDGNLHPFLLTKEEGGIKEEDLERIKKEMYDVTIRLGGTITGEHGIGKIRIKNLYEYLDKKALETMEKIKKVFDPNDILNPDTVVMATRSR